MSTEIQAQENAPREIEVAGPVMAVQTVIQRFQQLQGFVKEAMIEDSDYGKIPGCGDKPTLLKPGAEKLLLFYGLHTGEPDVEKIESWQQNPPFISYHVHVPIVSYRTREVIAVGVGGCNSMEPRYRYHVQREWHNTKPDGDGWSRRTKGDKSWWERQTINEDVAGQANTMLKIAVKRAVVDGALRATASSGMFTQDIEDYAQAQVESEQPAKPAARGRPKGKPSSGETPTCADCGGIIEGYTSSKGKTYTPADLVKFGMKDHGHPLCKKCAWAAKKAKEKAQADGQATNEAGEDDWLQQEATTPA